MKHYAAVVAAACLGCYLLSACSCSRQDGAVIIGSKNFTEQIILGEMAAQQLERKLHLTVERRLGLGGTLLAHEALVQGQIDLYPEYTGTAAIAVLKQRASTDSARAYMQVKDSYLQRYNLVWLPPLGFNDTFAMVVRTADAEHLQNPVLSGAAAARSWRLGVGFEFLTRPDGLSRLDSVYHMRWGDAPRTMDLGLLYQALAGKQIDMAAANSTDGVLTEPQYKILADDRNAFPAYNACFVVRQDALKIAYRVGNGLDISFRPDLRRANAFHEPAGGRATPSGCRGSAEFSGRSALSNERIE